MSIEKPEENEQALSPESIEKIDAEIKEILKSLYDFEFNSFDPEIQDEWYDIEMEAEVALDRVAAKKHLEQFIEKLKRESAQS